MSELDFDYCDTSGQLNAQGKAHYWIADDKGLFELFAVTGDPAGANTRPVGQFVSIIDAITAANKDNDA
jgi:5,10-methylenetetrahydrofolate reductase